MRDTPAGEETGPGRWGLATIWRTSRPSISIFAPLRESRSSLSPSITCCSDRVRTPQENQRKQAGPHTASEPTTPAGRRSRVRQGQGGHRDKQATDLDPRRSAQTLGRPCQKQIRRTQGKGRRAWRRHCGASETRNGPTRATQQGQTGSGRPQERPRTPTILPRQKGRALTPRNTANK